MSEPAQITKLLSEVRNGDKQAADRLMDAVYSNLQGIARKYFSSERPDHTLQPTALVHEAWMRLFQRAQVDWRDRGHFYAVAALQMRHILVEHGRQYRAARRGNGLKVQLDENLHGISLHNREVENLDELLERLHRLDPEAAKTVEMKFFGGLTDEEVAHELGCSHSTVRRHWHFAKAWLAHQMPDSQAQKA